jgi:hypothetical protein
MSGDDGLGERGSDPTETGREFAPWDSRLTNNHGDNYTRSNEADRFRRKR